MLSRLFIFTFLILTLLASSLVQAQDSTGRIDNIQWLDNGSVVDPDPNTDPDPNLPPLDLPNNSRTAGESGLNLIKTTVLEVADHPATPVVLSGAGAVSGVIYFSVGLATQTGVWQWGLWLGRLLGLFGGLFHFGRRRRPWGTVYDSVTKQPLDPAYLSLVSTSLGGVVQTAITDLEGRYGFLVAPGTYRLEANKTHYQFPSDNLRGRQADELYADLYFGETIEYRGEEVMRLNIPLDPVGFDWNEFAKRQGDYLQSFRTKLIWWSRFSRMIYLIGLILSFWLAWSRPDYWSYFSLGLYLVLGLGALWWRDHHPPTALRRYGGEETIAFAIIRLFLAGTTEQVKAVVSNITGHFYLLVAPGVYDLTVEEKLPDSSYSEIYRESNLNLKKGLLKHDIIVS